MHSSRPASLQRCLLIYLHFGAFEIRDARIAFIRHLAETTDERPGHREGSALLAVGLQIEGVHNIDMMIIDNR